MIPASYLFKDVYHQHWDEPEMPVIIERHHRPDGLLRPFVGLAATIIRRRRAQARHFGVHAYE